MGKRALITGVTGQDGAYLTQFLLNKDYKVFGTYRRLSTPNFWRLQYLEVFDDIHLIPCDLLDSSSLIEAVEISDPDEVYNLAAQSFVGASFEQPIGAGEITGLGVTRLLEAVNKYCPGAKFYQASTSELYGENQYEKQNETTPFYPSSPYSAAKLYAHHITRVYREGYDLFACNGILFNHESPLRGLEFVTRKITNAVAKIKLGMGKKVALGNIKSRRDWGYAPEYVKMMWQVLQQDSPDDFVVATGETHSVEEFLEYAFNHVGLNWEAHVEIKEKYKRPMDVNYLCGDYDKAKSKLGWNPKTKFKELVELMVDEDLNRWNRWVSGERFPWDAISYPNERKILSRKWDKDKA